MTTGSPTWAYFYCGTISRADTADTRVHTGRMPVGCRNVRRTGSFFGRSSSPMYRTTPTRTHAGHGDGGGREQRVEGGYVRPVRTGGKEWSLPGIPKLRDVGNGPEGGWGAGGERRGQGRSRVEVTGEDGPGLPGIRGDVTGHTDGGPPQGPSHTRR